MTGVCNHDNDALVTIMLGSNTERRQHNMDFAIARVCEMLDNAVVSEIIDEPDFTGRGKDYLNCVIAGRVTIAKDGIDGLIAREINRLHQIECEMGRQRDRVGIVEIDIDLVAVRTEGAERVIAPREYGTEIYRRLVAQIGVGKIA